MNPARLQWLLSEWGRQTLIAPGRLVCRPPFHSAVPRSAITVVNRRRHYPAGQRSSEGAPRNQASQPDGTVGFLSTGIAFGLSTSSISAVIPYGTAGYRQSLGSSGSVIELIKEAWGWLGVEPFEVIATNAFGNVIFTDHAGRYWRLCPEDLYCRVIAQTASDYNALLAQEDFVLDWEMVELVQEAHRVLGPLQQGRCYCLRLPGPLGGEYAASNLGSCPAKEVVGFSGDLAQQLRGLATGTHVVIRTTE